MSARLGVPSFAIFRSLARELTFFLFFASTAVLGITIAPKSATSTRPAMRTPNQKGLSFILFMAISLFVLRGLGVACGLHGSGGGLARLLADRHLQRHLVPRVVQRRLGVRLEGGGLRLRPSDVRRILLHAPERRAG